MLIDELKKRMVTAMKAHKTVEKELLRTALGEITMKAHTQGVEASDALVLEVLRKLAKSTEQTMAVAPAEQKEQLAQELAMLAELLPQAASVDSVRAALEAVSDAIVGAKSDGAATGVAMKHLKSLGLEADGKIVGQAVAALRASS